MNQLNAASFEISSTVSNSGNIFIGKGTILIEIKLIGN